MGMPQVDRRWSHVAAGVVGVVVLVSACGQGSNSQATPTASAPTSATTAVETPTPTVPTPTAASPAETPRTFAYQPLWPFTSPAEVTAWQAAYRDSGRRPWHLDAELTASYFTVNYLGFTEINEVVGRTIRGDDAWVSVGYTTEDVTEPYVAAEIHLVKYGTGGDAPWEVVGTKDTDLTLTTPKYGAVARSPLETGGRITGADESIVVEVRQPSSERVLGTSRPVPAGGTNQPWSATVRFSGATDPALTVVARTGGQYREVERFAVTAVRPG